MRISQTADDSLAASLPANLTRARKTSPGRSPEKIAVAVSQAVRGEAAHLHLSDSQRRDIRRALDAQDR
jgi:hypothetical protein